MKDNFYDIVRTRRSRYIIGNKETLSPEQVTDLLHLAVKHTPSAFNSQPARAIALFDDHHHKLWEIVSEALRKKVPEDQFARTEKKLAAFGAGYGTILFFIDEAVVQDSIERFPSYGVHFGSWADQSTGMLQYVMWAALDNEGLGVSLQHYNPLIDERVREEWNVPKNWRLVSQLVFGSQEAPPAAKEMIDTTEKVRVHRNEKKSKDEFHEMVCSSEFSEGCVE